MVVMNLLPHIERGGWHLDWFDGSVCGELIVTSRQPAMMVRVSCWPAASILARCCMCSMPVAHSIRRSCRGRSASWPSGPTKSATRTASSDAGGGRLKCPAMGWPWRQGRVVMRRPARRAMRPPLRRLRRSATPWPGPRNRWLDMQTPGRRTPALRIAVWIDSAPLIIAATAPI